MIVNPLPNRRLTLGRLGENKVRVIRFDIHEMKAEFPTAEFMVLNRRPTESAAYPVSSNYVTVNGNNLDWTIQSGDLLYQGMGACEIVASVDDKIAKSQIWLTEVLSALDGAGTPPEPWESWVEDVENAADRAEAAAAVAVHGPKIEDGVWYVWDADEGDYVSTGISAEGQDGQDGYSPSASVSKSGSTATISITDKNGTTTATVSDGDPTAIIDDTAGSGDTGKVWSADKSAALLNALTLATTEESYLENRLKNVDGYYYLAPSNFEIGNLSYSSSGWSYPAGNTTRVRTKQGVSYKLAVGDVVSLSSYTNAKFYLSWKNTSDVYKNSDWKTADYTITEAGDYVILLTNLTEVTQTSIDALYGLLSVKKKDYGIKSLETEIGKRDKNILLSMFGTADVPIDTNQIYNGTTHTFTSNPNRISFAEPYQFNTGDKLYIDVASGEKFYLMYFNKVNNTGTINTDFTEISGSATGWKTADTEYVSDGEKYVFVMVAFSGDTKITTETVKTKITLTKATLPDYWKSYLTTKAGDINTAMDAVGGIGDAFVFYTDPHWGSKNQKHTPQIIKFLLDNTSLREVYCGGDVIDSGSGGFTGYARSFRDITVFTARGNHDQNPNASSATDIVPDTEFYNRILKPIEHQVETNGNLYFYRDNPSSKIRYIFMDSGSARADTLTTTQLTWMQNALTSLTSGWSAVVIQHIVWDGAYASSAMLSLATQGTKTINAINDVWAQMNCQFIGIISGHVHRDYSITETTHGYPIIATSCDVGGTGRTDYDPDNPATVGTTNEHIMDVFIINKSTRTITVKRIGAGNDRSFTYPAMS